MPSQKTLEEYIKKIKKQAQSTPVSQQTRPQHKITGFYKETRFQETPIGKIPKEWKIMKIRDVATFIKRGKNPKYGDSEVVVIKTAQNYPERIRFEEAPRAHPDFLKELPQEYYLKPNDILINSTGTGSVGRVGFFSGYHRPCTVDSHITMLRVKQEVALPKFVFYYLSSTQGHTILESKASGSTNQIELYVDDIASVPVLIPPLEEQWGVAEVLSTVDRAIEGVDGVVDLLERLKKALMDLLLTGRVRVREENGKLVFYRETEFQETSIGKIPKEWKLVKFKEVAEIRKGRRISESVKSVAFISMEAIPDNSLYAKYELRSMDEVKSYVYCEPGDILLAKITPSFENGKQGIIPEELQGKIVLATTEVYPLKCKNVDKYFLFYLLKYPLIRNKLASLMRGTTGRKRVPREALEELLVPYPPITEQRRITEILMNMDRAIELCQEKRERLKRLKRGLMDLLLTGRFRVRIERVA